MYKFYNVNCFKGILVSVSLIMKTDGNKSHFIVNFPF